MNPPAVSSSSAAAAEHDVEDDAASTRTYSSMASDKSANTSPSSVSDSDSEGPEDDIDSDREDDGHDTDDSRGSGSARSGAYTPETEAFWDRVWADQAACDASLYERLNRLHYYSTCYYHEEHPQHSFEPFVLCYNSSEFLDDEPKLLIHQSSASLRPYDLGVGHMNGKELRNLALSMEPGSAVIYRDWCCHRLEALSRENEQRNAIDIYDEYEEIVMSCDGTCWTKSKAGTEDEAGGSPDSARQSGSTLRPSAGIPFRKPTIDWVAVADSGVKNIQLRSRLAQDLEGLSRWPKNAPPELMELEDLVLFDQCEACRLEMLLEVHKEEVAKRRAERESGQRAAYSNS